MRGWSCFGPLKPVKYVDFRPHVATFSRYMKAPASVRSDSMDSADQRTPLQRFGFAIAAVMVAFAVRSALNPLLKDLLPFGAFIIATILVAWYSGFIPSALTFFSGFLLGNWFFLPPHHSFASIAQAGNVGANISTLLVGLAIILFGRSMHLA